MNGKDLINHVDSCDDCDVKENVLCREGKVTLALAIQSVGRELDILSTLAHNVIERHMISMINRDTN